MTDIDTPPSVATGIPAQTPDEDALYSFALPAGTFADDAGEDALTLAATLADGTTPLPAWLDFDPATATFSGTPSQADVDAGPITVKVTATDAQGDLSRTSSCSRRRTSTTRRPSPARSTRSRPRSAPPPRSTCPPLRWPTRTATRRRWSRCPRGTSLPAGIALVGTSLEVADTTAEGVYVMDVFANDTLVILTRRSA